MGSLTLSKHFMLIAFDFLFFELLFSFEKYDVRIWVVLIFVSLIECVLLIVII